MPLGSPITTGAWPSFLWEGINRIWDIMDERYAPQYLQLFDEIDSNKAYEQYVQKTQLPPAVIKREGSSVKYAGETEGYKTQLVNLTYGLGYIITEEAREDLLYAEVANSLTEDLHNALHECLELLASDFYNNAFTTTAPGITLPDGASVCSTAHVHFSGGTYQNRPNVDVPISEAALEDMVVLIRGATDDVGNPRTLVPTCIITSKRDEFTAQRVLKSNYTPASAGNAINVLNQGSYYPDHYVNIRLTAPGSWYVRTNIQKGRGLIYQNRRAPKISRDNEFDTDNYKVKGTFRAAFGINNPLALYASNGP